MQLTSLLSVLLSIICPLIAIAFYTLLERKGIGYAQLRKGPNKVSIAGIPQPLLDALKLFAKEWATPQSANPALFFFFPFLALLLALAVWSLYPNPYNSLIISFSFIAFLAISRINVYCTLGRGWASNSKYALLGALRGIAQTISYEVRIALTLLGALAIFKTLEISSTIYKSPVIAIIIIPFITSIWLVSCLAEANRAPFDFAEGERELVSGFNVEYRAGGFALIFIAEYTNMLFLSLLSFTIFFPKPQGILACSALVILITCLFGWGFIWARAALPRIRYDRLINLSWKVFLPTVILTLIALFPLTFTITWYRVGFERITLIKLNMRTTLQYLWRAPLLLFC